MCLFLNLKVYLNSQVKPGILQHVLHTLIHLFTPTASQFLSLKCHLPESLNSNRNTIKTQTLAQQSHICDTPYLAFLLLHIITALFRMLYTYGNLLGPLLVSNLF